MGDASAREGNGLLIEVCNVTEHSSHHVLTLIESISGYNDLPIAEVAELADAHV
jgi:hypothetical protein